MPAIKPPQFPADTDPDSRSECPECWSLVRVRRALEHWQRHRDEDKWRAQVELGLRVADPGVVAWPEPDPVVLERTDTATIPAGPYAPEPAGEAGQL